MKLNVHVHFIMSAIAFWKLQVAECLTFPCQASSCWDNKCLSSFAHSGGCRLQTAGARQSLNTIPIRTPVLVPPLWLASLHARNLLLSNIYTQLEWQMYRNFTPPHPTPYTWNRCAYFCVFWSFGRGGLFCEEQERRRAKLQHRRSEISIASFHPVVSGGGRCGWLQLLGEFLLYFFGWKVGERQSLCFTFLGEGEIQIYCWSCDNWRARECRGKTKEAQHITRDCKTKGFIWFGLKHNEKKNDFFFFFLKAFFITNSLSQRAPKCQVHSSNFNTLTS